MAYNQQLADRIRALLAGAQTVEEKKMFRGIAFMVDEKMCICVAANDIMCRIDPAIHESLLQEKPYCRTVVMRGREYKGYVLVPEDELTSDEALSYWTTLCLSFNKEAKASKKKRSKKLAG